MLKQTFFLVIYLYISGNSYGQPDSINYKPQAEKFYYGINAGTAFSQAEQYSYSPNQTTCDFIPEKINWFSYAAGIRTGFKIKDWMFFQPELYVSEKKTSFIIKDQYAVPVGYLWPGATYTDLYNNIYTNTGIELHSIVNFRNYHRSNFLYFNIGPYISMNIQSSKELSFIGVSCDSLNNIYPNSNVGEESVGDAKDEIKTFDFGASMAAGFAKKNTLGGRVYVEIKANKGFVNIIDEDYKDDVLRVYFSRYYESLKMQNFYCYLLVGYDFVF